MKKPTVSDAFCFLPSAFVIFINFYSNGNTTVKSHLKSSSPAIGTGLIFQGYVRGMFDIDGDKRCDNHRINIGADQ